jgi:3-methyladenine DNA glycosylase AlkD
MTFTAQANDVLAKVNKPNLKLGDLRAIAKQIKKHHALAQELWAAGGLHPRLLAALLFDPKFLSEQDIDRLAADLVQHEPAERGQIADWLLTNQLSKDKRLTALMATWENHPSPIMRRWFWCHQARLRWMGQTPPPNTENLLASLEARMAEEVPDVQWMMNFCAGWIGIYEPVYRDRCVALGERLGLYKGEKVSKGCTPSYLPEFIRIEVAKRS